MLAASELAGGWAEFGDPVAGVALPMFAAPAADGPEGGTASAGMSAVLAAAIGVSLG